MAFKGTEGKVVSKEVADKITGKYTANKETIQKEGKEYVESHFIGIETIKELISGVPVKSILGARIKHCIQNKDGIDSPNLLIEIVTKDNTSQYRAASDLPNCPTDCGK